ncbi:GDSL Lipase/Acylhydrolase [Thelephora ganbajun]|uniref:GDSL Lipase/Acylhydrolase n=1 Tax=Thelephora ganbajun TaxID=370292 RepID=A0ACB6ZMW1_THEGA|nr:GDSL Lipase/Acylhydrolase [Thelephora ganbajun]
MAANVLDTVMLFGDSITQGSWDLNGIGARLSFVYARKLDVLNRGLSGYNTEWAIPVFEQLLQVFAKKEEQPYVPAVRLLTIWFGANDSVLPSERQHVPLAQFIANLKHLITMVKSPSSEYYSPKTRILLISPPPVNTYQRSAELVSRDPPRNCDREFGFTKLYAEAVVKTAQEEGAAVVDVWTVLWEAAGKDERALSAYLLDGLHLNAKGYELAYNAINESIEQSYPEIHHQNLQYAIPRHDELDPSNIRESVRARRLV